MLLMHKSTAIIFIRTTADVAGTVKSYSRIMDTSFLYRPGGWYARRTRPDHDYDYDV